MQVWDQVKVKDDSAGHPGEAGVVQAIEGPADAQIATVKLDLHDEPIKLPVTELVRL